MYEYVINGTIHQTIKSHPLVKSFGIKKSICISTSIIAPKEISNILDYMKLSVDMTLLCNTLFIRQINKQII